MQHATPEAQIAHVLRRCGFGPTFDIVSGWTDAGPQALIDSMLENDNIFFREDDDLYSQFAEGEDFEEGEALISVLNQMMTAANPLHERMTWFWHTHFTSSAEAGGYRFVWRQHHLVRRLALGNFADLARQITTDPAMLFYLDGVGSNGDNPNENYAREFLELFTLGRDAGYGEDDIRAAARILSGWHVNWDTGEVNFDESSGYGRPATFMGERRRWTVDSFVEFVTSLPACHRHVASQMYFHLVGPDLSDKRRDELAQVFAESGLEIKALVGAILSGDDFLGSMHSRARQPLEWVIGALHALGFSSASEAELKYWQLNVLGQVPFLPPNVAGWPLDDRWASTSQVVARTSMLLNWELPRSTIDSVPPTVDAVLARCGIYDPSTSTRAALDKIERDHSEFDYRLELLFIAALTSPEFALL